MKYKCSTSAGSPLKTAPAELSEGRLLVEQRTSAPAAAAAAASMGRLLGEEADWRRLWLCGWRGGRGCREPVEADRDWRRLGLSTDASPLCIQASSPTKSAHGTSPGSPTL
jgi:hypothetical protein